MNHEYIGNVVDLTNPGKNVIYNMTHEEAVNILKSGDAEAVRRIDGQFSLVSVDGKTIRMARSIGRPIRYFIAKKAAGPVLILAERIDTICTQTIWTSTTSQIQIISNTDTSSDKSRRNSQS